MNHLLCYVKENQISPAYSFLNFFIFLSLQWTVGWRIMYTWIGQLVFIYSFISSIFFLSNSKRLNFLSHSSVRPTKLKLDTHMSKGLIYCVHQIQAARIYLFLYFSSFFLSLQLAKIKNLHLHNCFNLTSDGCGRGYVSFARCLLYLCVEPCFVPGFQICFSPV